MSNPRVTGAIRYAQDVEFEGMLHASILRSPYPHARILRVDASAVPDSVVVLTPDDIRDFGSYGCQIQDQTVLPRDRVRFVGDPVVAVAAPTKQEADEALNLIDVEYERLPGVFDAVEAVAEGAPLVHEHHAISENDAAYFGIRPQEGTNICHRFRIRHGDMEEGFKQADVVVEETYRTPGAQHASMEPHASVARWQDGRLEVWTGTQTPFNLRMDLAGIFNISESQIRIISPPMGGAFGAKTFVRTEAIAACLAQKAGRPVKIVLSRYEEWLTLNRHPATLQVKLGARADGTLVAKRVVCWVDTGAYADCGPGVAQKMGYAAVGPYRIPQVWVDSLCVYTNLPPNGAFRGYGAMQAVWASERTMDILAAKLGMDPLELRLKNVLVDGDQFCTGEIMHDVHFIECLHAAAGTIGWADNKQGKGLCVLMKGMQTPSRASIVVEANDDGGYTVHCATAEMGQGAWHSIRLMAAELLGVELEKVHYAEPDTDIVPYDTRTTSSRSTYMMGRALVEAVRDLKRKGELGYGECVNKGGLDPDTGQGIASTHWHQGAAAAEVRVDEETGKFQVLKLYTSIYAGHVVNRPGAELQNEGSMIMGLGTTLFEEITFEDGQPANANLSDYNIPAAGDLPESFTYDLFEREGAEVHGLGETALPPVPPAIGNALYSLGIHVTDLPLSAEKVLNAIDSRPQAKGGRA
ncbi:MAG: xanthine dehydrogenase family protein molybdopterin-binding subunit [Chloroflexi bacterium]|nr:MAG: xanthine dehydrogenase family protein molybdopterin-binding subunit [Chloroflexota bacterium]